ncbi:hydroxyethylthiazole kinase [Syntrophomonas erecta]
MLNNIAACLRQVRENPPLVHAITNYVTINDCANILLCMGASPAMCEVKTEVEEFVELISAVYINLGTPTEGQRLAAIAAVKKATEFGKPVILDPVACGVISWRREIIEQLFKSGKITVIKGNMGEIKFLAGYEGKVRGVDSLDDGEDGIEACQSLARKYNTIIAATGPTDIISDGKTTYLIENGTPMLSMVSGTGCMVGAMVGATLAVSEDKVMATAAAIMAMGIAGEKAAASIPRILPGTFKVKLMDCMYELQEEDIMKGGKIRCL